jgi:hypothetical protein
LPEEDDFDGMIPELRPVGQDVKDSRADQRRDQDVKNQIHDPVGIETDAPGFFQGHNDGEKES